MSHGRDFSLAGLSGLSDNANSWLLSLGTCGSGDKAGPVCKKQIKKGLIHLITALVITLVMGGLADNPWVVLSCDSA